ncbi:hypothetical protein BCF74_13627 [Knoellia remsis]|uniref:Prevent-host-death family protein n=1 Tax=Knoellia remsis TaxID=407159 RepID=A0A2T0U0H0_9MICO|nr:prevent-host-death protein [Knoellia remsis]PRY51412.1 hypothetical protein BCF74_13627 [Knoellia remsis]
MSESISQRELRNDSGRIMRGLEDGHTYVITRHSEPIGELRPLRRRRFVDARVAAEIFRGGARIDRGRFFADIDDAASQEIEPRG